MNLLNVAIHWAGYESDKKIIEDIFFSLKKGEIIGLIGPNGAGKSTIIKTILGLTEHKEGEIIFQEGSSYSYIPERPVFYDELTIWEHLDFIGAVEEMPQDDYKKRAKELLQLYKLQDFAHQFPGSFSKGMQQKAMIIFALITEPSIYIIDEPFVGLDPSAMKLFLSSIEKVKQEGAGILMSTHVLDTAEKVCDRFILVHNGHIAAAGTLEEIRRQSNIPGGSLFDCFHKLTEESPHVEF